MPIKRRQGQITQIVALNSSHLLIYRLRSLTYLITFSLAAFVAVAGSALAQEIAIRVNGEPITSHDIVQRTLFQNLPSPQNRISDFYERLNVPFCSDKIKETFRQKVSAAQPRTPKEAQRVAERINKELIEDATMQILFRTRRHQEVCD